MRNPLKGWCAKYVSETGEINWALACTYELQWSQPVEGAPAQTTMSLFGAHFQNLNVTIDAAFQLIDPWDVFKARLHQDGNPPVNYFLYQILLPGQGPNSSNISTKKVQSWKLRPRRQRGSSKRPRRHWMNPGYLMRISLVQKGEK